jgi:hypothetical protein
MCILEGADQVGKSTILKKLGEVTGNRYVIIHRAHLSNFVYAKKRKEDGREFFRGFTRLCSCYPVALVLVISDWLESEYKSDQRFFVKTFKRWKSALSDSYLAVIFDNSTTLEDLDKKILKLKEILRKHEDSGYFPLKVLRVS